MYTPCKLISLRAKMENRMRVLMVATLLAVLSVVRVHSREVATSITRGAS